MGNLSRLPEVQFRLLCDRRAAAVILAVRAYQLDHSGALPPTLEALVPQYLPKLPADPMRGDGATFGYLPRAATPCIYSVGTDAIDDRGATKPGSTYRWDGGKDVSYPLTPLASPTPAPPTTPTTTTAPAATQSGS